MAAFPKFPGFEDLDNEAVCAHIQAALTSPKTNNFAVEFDSTKAYAALDLDVSSVKQILQIERSKASSARWINIWGPESQREAVTLIANHYGFSPRLLGIMITEPSKSERKEAKHPDNEKSDNSPQRKVGFNFPGTVPAGAHSIDPEKGRNTSASEESTTTHTLNHYDVVNRLWHYCSVDQGPQYLCLGYNSLLNQPKSQERDTKEDDSDDETSEDAKDPRYRTKDKPQGLRVWSWLVICTDGTVISIHENRLAASPGISNEESLKCVRYNLVNVFRQLSTANDDYRRANPINTLDIRPGLKSNLSSKVTIGESPSLLFYYLFDDWYTSYYLVSEDGYQYAGLLEDLRKQLFGKPQVVLIDKLHQYGRQLAVLKRLYQSYSLIIESILDRQRHASSNQAYSGSCQSQRNMEQSDSASQPQDASQLSNRDPILESNSSGVSLSTSATVRFGRLRDRINLYALGEIQECLDEKESLVFLTFNLLTHKESQAVERLTRIALLLTKVTILFMPVSLMTGYFSTQIADLSGVYTSKTYWSCFAVIVTLSLLFLLVFGLLSDTLESGIIYNALRQRVAHGIQTRWKGTASNKNRKTR